MYTFRLTRGQEMNHSEGDTVVYFGSLHDCVEELNKKVEQIQEVCVLLNMTYDIHPMTGGGPDGVDTVMNRVVAVNLGTDCEEVHVFHIEFYKEF